MSEPRFDARTTFVVEAAPFGYPGGYERWREHCRDAALEHIATAGLVNTQKPVKIVARFFVKDSRHKSDLDNMIKLLVDSLGAAQLFGRSSGGGHKTEWNTDDHWVDAIDAEKLVDKANPRVEVTIMVARAVG